MNHHYSQAYPQASINLGAHVRNDIRTNLFAHISRTEVPSVMSRTDNLLSGLGNVISGITTVRFNNMLVRNITIKVGYGNAKGASLTGVGADHA